MITAIDTSVLIDVLNRDEKHFDTLTAFRLSEKALKYREELCRTLMD